MRSVNLGRGLATRDYLHDMTRILVIAVVAMSTLATSHAQTDKLGFGAQNRCL